MNIAIVAQHGRILFQSILFAYSLQKMTGSAASLYVCVPENSPLWDRDPSVRHPAAIDYLQSIGAKIVSFRNQHFGSRYPHSNKIYAIDCLPSRQPFMFFDSDVVITEDISSIIFDYSKPSGLHGGGSWPVLEGNVNPRRDEIWHDLYSYIGADFDGSLNTFYPVGHVRRYMYFNGGFFYANCPNKFHEQWLGNALKLETYLAGLDQPTFPWLDQISLGVTCAQLDGVHEGVPRGTIDQASSCHYHYMLGIFSPEHPLAITVAKDAWNDPVVGKLLEGWPAFRDYVNETGEKLVREIIEMDSVTRRFELILSLRRRGLGHK